MKTTLLLLAALSASAFAGDENPFANITLRGLGNDVVVIQRRDADHTITLKGNQPAEGFTVKKVNWSSVPGASTVVLLNDRGEEGTVGFDQNLKFPKPPVPKPPKSPEPPQPAKERGK